MKEYRILWLPSSRLEPGLNELATLGWQFVAVINGSIKAPMLLLEREEEVSQNRDANQVPA